MRTLFTDTKVTDARIPETLPIRPGVHSHSLKRRLNTHPVRRRSLYYTRIALFIFGLCGIGYYAYSAGNEYIYQVYENWAFDRHIAGQQATFADYAREKTPFGFLAGESAPVHNVDAAPVASPAPSVQLPQKLEEGAVLGRVEIARLNLSAIVREGVDDKTLSLAVGHLPTTALPGQTGNFAIAAHRDTLFRALKDIQKDDIVSFKSPMATYTYKVTSTKIVRPSDLSVLKSQPGDSVLTMITCYPFYYVGSAPKRFIVTARLIEG